MPTAVTVKRRVLSRRATLSMLSKLEESMLDDRTFRCVTKLSPSDKLDRLDISKSASLSSSLMSVDASDRTAWDWLPDSARHSGEGLAFVYRHFGDADYRPLMAIRPPFPIQREDVVDDFNDLYSIIDSDVHVAIALLRLGHAAIGIAHDGTLVASKRVTRYVRSQHRAGGQSAGRFKRNREKQVREFLAKAGSAAVSLFDNYDHRIEWLSLGGDQHVLGQFLASVSLPNGLSTRVLSRRLSVERPNREALTQAAKDVWSSVVFEPHLAT